MGHRNGIRLVGLGMVAVAVVVLGMVVVVLVGLDLVQGMPLRMAY